MTIRTLIQTMLNRPELSNRAVAAHVHVPRRTVDGYRQRLRRCSQPKEHLLRLSSAQLAAVLLRQNGKHVRASLDCAAVLRDPSTTVKGHWRRHQAQHGRHGCTYSQYARRVRQHRLSLNQQTVSPGNRPPPPVMPGVAGGAR